LLNKDSGRFFKTTFINMKKRFLFLNLLYCTICLHAQSVKVIASGTKTSLRGLSVVSDKVVWASGSAGTVTLSIDSGNTWKWMTVNGFEKTDFRDIEAFDENTAVIMGIDSPAVILKTIDAGDTWNLVYRNDTKGMFLDAMDFVNEKEGVVIGDPIDGFFFIAETKDTGNTWQDKTGTYKMKAEKGEAAFASSGTNIRKTKNGTSIFVSGGLSSNLFFGFNKIPLAITQGKETTGANSIASKNNKMFIIVGGDFNTKDSTTKNCFITKNAGKTFTTPLIGPSGYRSCIEYINKRTWITCGINGTDITENDGKHFKQISTTGFHVCRRSKNGSIVFFAGGGGRLGKLLN
jgi:hypothetical protein